MRRRAAKGSRPTKKHKQAAQDAAMARQQAQQRQTYVPYTILAVALALSLLSIAGFLYRRGATPLATMISDPLDATKAAASPRSAATDRESDHAAATPRAPGEVMMYTYEIVRELPHDPAAFTQGLEFSVYKGRDVFWESTGNYGKSQVREVDVDTGEVMRSVRLPTALFGEGLTRIGDRLLQLTWHSGRALDFSNIDTFHEADVVGMFPADMGRVLRTVGAREGPHVRERDTGLRDGWGAAYDAERGEVVVSDSSDTMVWLDPETLERRRSAVVRDRGRAVPWVNELEMVEGEVWGNVWMTPCIARIDPADAAVTGWVLLEGLAERTRPHNAAAGRRMDVLNGIAYDTARDRLFVTGKWWARMYEIRVVPLPAAEQAAARERALTLCHAHAHPV
eukprot:jgi/Ulvmu1/10633/UM066_0012.1